VIRPTTPADVYTRETGAGKQSITVLPERNFAFNTTGDWRRVIVPLDGVVNESNLYVRFTLITDSNKVAGGWFIDDVIIAQGHELFASNSIAYTNVYLLGVNSPQQLYKTVSGQSGLFSFGFLPAGAYALQTSDGLSGPYVLPKVDVQFELLSLTLGLNTITWETEPDEEYQVQYADTVFGIWTNLPGGPVTATGTAYSVLDPLPIGSNRFYRVLILNQPN
jgi:hypothetical protein